MKKLSLVLAIILLVSSFVIPVSAQEKVYTATFYADGVFGYKEDSENLIICSLTLENAADFSYGEVIFRYNPDVLKGSPENISTPPTDPDTRKFNHSYERGEDYTTIHFEHNENVQKLTDSYSPMFIFRTVSVGEHDLSIEINAYNDNNEKTEYTVKYECDLYGQVVEYSQLPAVDKSKIEIIRNTGLYLNELKNAADITKIFDDDIVIFEPGKGILEESEIIPNGAYIAALYEGYIADKIRICVANDVDCDAKITAADARLALRYSAKLESLLTTQVNAADVNKDGKITSADARLILRKAAGLDKN